MTTRRTRDMTTLVLFALCLFTSAFLMFMMQPMVGRMLLPLVGGAPGVWITAMTFFQVMLVAGYALAHGLARLSPVHHSLTYTAILIAGLFFLPYAMGSQFNDWFQHPNAFSVMAILFVTTALPFIALSLSASTLQRLFSVSGHDRAEDPYFLYAASNLGSFAGLLLYPFLVERIAGLRLQSWGWMAGYFALICMTALCPLLIRDGAQKNRDDGAAFLPLERKARLKIIFLAFIPSSLMMGLTTHITTDLFSAPLIWIFPLGLYLLTFVIAFSPRLAHAFSFARSVHSFAVIAILAIITLNLSVRVSIHPLNILCHVVTFFIVALSCHIHLAEKRPADTRNLTDYFLMISVGGALGGIFNSLIAPFIFPLPAEYPLVLVLSLAAAPPASSAFLYGLFSGKSAYDRLISAVVLCLSVVYIMMGMDWLHFSSQQSASAFRVYLVFAALILTMMCTSRTLKIILLCAFVLAYFSSQRAALVSVERGFMGILRVFNSTVTAEGVPYSARLFTHGTTTHGTQLLKPPLDRFTAAYYTPTGPMGDIFAFFGPRRIVVVGLGVGTMMCYKTPKSEMTFIDIDPNVELVAKRDFTYLKNCAGKTPARVILGDGRLEMAKMADGSFDLILLDAFSADSVPTHMLTSEAITLYLQKLAPGGLIMFNISNRYFDLATPLARAAQHLGLQNRVRFDFKPVSPFATPSAWILMARNDVDFTLLSASGWVTPPPMPGRVWTDDKTDLLENLKLHSLIP